MKQGWHNLMRKVDRQDKFEEKNLSDYKVNVLESKNFDETEDISDEIEDIQKLLGKKSLQK